MTRIMFDSTAIGDIPASAAMVAYYVDGLYAVSTATVKARFPNAVLVGISAVGTNAGVVGDVEPGCMTVSQGVAWVKTRRASGVDPTIYCNEMNAWAGIRQAFHNAGVVEPHYWVADYDNILSIPSGAIAKQYANPTLTGGHYDKSIVADIWPGVDSSEGELDMFLFVRSPDGSVYIVGESGKRHVQRPEYLKLAAVAGSEAALKVQAITVADLATIPDVPSGIPGPKGTDGINGKDGKDGAPGVVPDHHHVTGPIVP